MADVNLLAVLAAAIVAMAIGAFWYSQNLFGKQWMKYSGISPDSINESQKDGMKMRYGLAFLSLLITSYILAAVIDISGMTPFSVAFLGWLGFSIPVFLNSVLWDGKSWQLFLINAGQMLTALLAMAIVFDFWM
jgi:hypothetical protein